MTNPIHALLADAKMKLERVERKIAEAEHDRDMLRAQVDAYATAAKAVDASLPQDGLAMAKPTLAAQVVSMAEGKVKPAKEEWNHVFARLYHEHANGFGYEEIASVADRLGVPYKRASLRTKMMNYVNESVLERVGSGRFRITDNGANFFNVPQHAPVAQARRLLDL